MIWMNDGSVSLLLRSVRSAVELQSERIRPYMDFHFLARSCTSPIRWRYRCNSTALKEKGNPTRVLRGALNATPKASFELAAIAFVSVCHVQISHHNASVFVARRGLHWNLNEYNWLTRLSWKKSKQSWQLLFPCLHTAVEEPRGPGTHTSLPDTHTFLPCTCV